MKKITFNIASGNSQGLTNDAIILTNALTELYGGNVNIRHFSGSDTKFTNIKKLLSLIINKYLFQQKQITFHLEEIYTEISPFSDKNILIPNQEWLRTGTQKAIKPETHIWCKTHYAVKQLKHLNDNVEYLGFCSRNLLDESITPNFNAFIHIAGKSEQKGTIAVLDVWQKHPEWPLLKVISRREEHLEYQAENIEFITEFLTECQLKSLINQCGVHLCPSESEGFGHNIVEAMSANSIVVTTDAPPMNELIHPDEICLVNYNKTDKRYFSELFFIDKSHFEAKIIQLIAMKELDKINIFKQNQSKFDKLKVQFVKQLQSKLNNWNL
tara:strand:+ start:16831 stop:17811 length:981 start_codon:yes stop_codon:yes gene_type:complete